VEEYSPLRRCKQWLFKTLFFLPSRTQVGIKFLSSPNASCNNSLMAFTWFAEGAAYSDKAARKKTAIRNKWYNIVCQMHLRDWRCVKFAILLSTRGVTQIIIKGPDGYWSGKGRNRLKIGTFVATHYSKRQNVLFLCLIIAPSQWTTNEVYPKARYRLLLEMKFFYCHQMQNKKIATFVLSCGTR